MSFVNGLKRVRRVLRPCCNCPGLPSGGKVGDRSDDWVGRDIVGGLPNQGSGLPAACNVCHAATQS